MAESAGILFKIKGDSKDGVKSLDETIAALKLTEKEMDAVNEHARKMGEQIGSSIKDSAQNITKAFAIIGTSAVAFGGALLKITKDTSDFGSMIYDASQKTGIGAEKLSALKVAADASGSSFEQVTAGIASFGVEVGKAAQGNDKAVETMKLLGVTSADLDTALKQAFTTIAAGTTDTEKLALATAAFGKEVGPNLIPLIKDANGNIDVMVARAKELGLTITDSAAAAADQFGDNLDALSKQLTGVGYTIGNNLMPIFNGMARDMSTWLKNNRGEVDAWATSFAVGIRKVSDTMAGWVKEQQQPGSFMETLGTIDKWITSHSSIYAYGERLRAQAVADQPKVGSVADLRQGDDTNTRNNSVFMPNDLPTEGDNELEKARKKREADFQKELESRSRGNALMLAGARTAFTAIQEAEEESFDKREINANEYAKRSLAHILEYTAQVEKLIANAEDIDKQQAKNPQDKLNAEKEALNSLAALRREVAREAVDIRKNVEAQKKEDVAKEKKDTEDLKKAETERLDKYAEGVRQLMELEQQRFDAEWLHMEELRKKAEEDHDWISSTMIVPSDSPGEGEAENNGPFASWADSWDRFVQHMQAAAPGIKETLSDVGAMTVQFGENMMQAVGGAIEQWALYGGSVTKALRQALAAELAHIAGVATINALYATALGFMRLAELDFPAAANAFISAGIWAAVAGGAALAARAIAPKNENASRAFSQQAASSTSSRADRNVDGQGKQYSSRPDQVMSGGINSTQKLEITFGLKGDGVLELLDKSVRSNGRGREIILRTVEGT